jgi:hypothetical protein
VDPSECPGPKRGRKSPGDESEESAKKVLRVRELPTLGASALTALPSVYERNWKEAVSEISSGVGEEFRSFQTAKR